MKGNCMLRHICTKRTNPAEYNRMHTNYLNLSITFLNRCFSISDMFVFTSQFNHNYTILYLLGESGAFETLFSHGSSVNDRQAENSVCSFCSCGMLDPFTTASHPVNKRSWRGPSTQINCRVSTYCIL